MPKTGKSWRDGRQTLRWYYHSSRTRQLQLKLGGRFVDIDRNSYLFTTGKRVRIIQSKGVRGQRRGKWY